MHDCGLFHHINAFGCSCRRQCVWREAHHRGRREGGREGRVPRLEPLQVRFDLQSSALASLLHHPREGSQELVACRSKLAASVLAGVDNIHIKPGCKVLYLGAASGTSVSHVSDIVGPEGAVYAVEFSHRSGETPFKLNTFCGTGRSEGCFSAL